MPQVEEYGPPRFKQSFNVTDITSDNLLNVLSQSNSGFNLKNVGMDDSI